MKEIGGYFEWEVASGSRCPHPDASVALKSGRSCVRLVSEIERPAKVWLPYYSCDGVLEPFQETGIPTAFYPIDENLEIKGPWPEVLQHERLLYINYFGLKAGFASALEKHYGPALWLDHAQAFFFKPVDPRAFHFNSARKFFGVPDGAYLYVPSEKSSFIPEEIPRHTAYSLDHLFLRLQGETQAGYPFFLDNEARCGGAVARMSTLSEAALSHLNYDDAAQRRRTNYACLHAALNDRNHLPAHLLVLSEQAVPLCYPFLPGAPMDRPYFWDRKLYIPTFWKECLDRAEGFAWEKKLTSDLLPLPIDHRYTEADMERIVSVITRYKR